MNIDKLQAGGFSLGELVVFGSSTTHSIWDVLTEEEVYPERQVMLPYDMKLSFVENRIKHIEQIRDCEIKVGHSSYKGGTNASLIWKVVCSKKKLNWLMLKTGATILDR
jgi:hypothetical protein